ncbi:MAG: DUF5684 domain-containing protein [Flavobacteriales bacterium]|nr:DUF5684 domain-containing protein [Flavobacteriales bacterium]
MQALAAASIFVMLIYLAIIVLMIASLWKIFTKAGKPGWACIVPIYNIIVMLEMVGKPTWWVILYLIPFVNIVVAIIINIQLAKVFGKDTGFAIGMILLPFIFFPMLAFGNAQYTKPSAELSA